MPQILINKGACQVVSNFVISDRIDKMLTLSILIHFVLNSQLFSRNFFLLPYLVFGHVLIVYICHVFSLFLSFVKGEVSCVFQ